MCNFSFALYKFRLYCIIFHLYSIMIIHLYCIRLFIYICNDKFHWDKEDEMRGEGGGVVAQKMRGGYAGEG